MLTVHEVSERAGVSVRTLHHYDDIGLLRPSARTEAGYRLYDEGDLARLQQILLFRELEFPLADIRAIVDSPGFDRRRVLERQLELLELKHEHVGKLVDLAKNLLGEEVGPVSFVAFDTSKMDEYKAAAKAKWGSTPAWSEYEAKSADRTKKEEAGMGEELLALFVPFGKMAAADADPTSPEALTQAALIQTYISEHFYTCTNEIFAQLGQAYGAGGEFTVNINASAGAGAAEFASKAVEAYCAK